MQRGMLSYEQLSDISYIRSEMIRIDKYSKTEEMKSLKQADPEKYKEAIASCNPDFFDRYPVFLVIIVSEQLNMVMLEYLLQMKQFQRDTGKTQEEMDNRVGTHLAGYFVPAEVRSKLQSASGPISDQIKFKLEGKEI